MRLLNCEFPIHWPSQIDATPFYSDWECTLSTLNLCPTEIDVATIYWDWERTFSTLNLWPSEIGLTTFSTVTGPRTRRRQWAMARSCVAEDFACSAPPDIIFNCCFCHQKCHSSLEFNMTTKGSFFGHPKTIILLYHMMIWLWSCW